MLAVKAASLIMWSTCVAIQTLKEKLTVAMSRGDDVFSIVRNVKSSKKIRYKSSFHNFTFFKYFFISICTLYCCRRFIGSLILSHASSLLLWFPDKPELHTPTIAEVTRYSSEEMNSGNESNETHLWTEQERQADFNRHKEELMKRKRRRKKRTSSSMQSSCFQGESSSYLFNLASGIWNGDLGLFDCWRDFTL